MKKIIMLGLAIIAFTGAKAQLGLGVKTGLNFAGLRGSDAVDSKNRAGTYGGLVATIGLPGKFHLRPELVYSQQGAKIIEDAGKAKLDAGYINFPIMLEYRLSNGLYAETGPQFGYLLSSYMKVAGEDFSVKDQVKNADLSWGFGAGFMTRFNVGVNARYNLGLSKLDKQTEGKVYNGVFQFGLMYFFKTFG